MVKTLNQKLLRDLKKIKFQVLSISLIIGSGIMYLMGSLISYKSLLLARDLFYKDYKLANGYHYSQFAPQSIIPIIRKLPGVLEVEERVSERVTIECKEKSRTAKGKILSITQNLNQLYIERGTLPLKSSEVAINSSFAKSNQLHPGDTLTILLGGRKVQLQITAIVQSPEFVYIFPEGGFLPDNKNYGILWAQKRTLETLLNRTGAFNEILFHFQFKNQVEKERTYFAIQQLMDKYASFGVISLDKLPSYSLLNNEFNQLKTTALFLPFIFIFVSSFILQMVLNRIVSKEREQIATLKANGMTSWEIGFHYFLIALIVCSIGTTLGILLGIYLGDVFVDLYSEYFYFPNLQPILPIESIFVAIIFGFSSGVIGFWTAFRKVNQLQPASAMRPPTPETYKNIQIESWLSNSHLEWKMVLRNLLKSPIRTILSIVGLSFAIMILILGNFLKDNVDYMVHLQYNIIQREDIMLNFSTLQFISLENHFLNKIGILYTEPIRFVPIRLKKRGIHKETVLYGLEENPILRRIVNDKYNSIPIPKNGILMNKNIANELQIKPGDKVWVEVLEGNQSKFYVFVAGVIEEVLGQGIYISRKLLNKKLKESNVFNQLYIQLDPNKEKFFIQKWKNYPAVATITSKRELVQSFQEVLQRSLLATSIFIMLFTSIIGIGIIYNLAMIILAERIYEMGTLRILGFHTWEIFKILIGEIVLLIMVAIPIGIYLGNILAFWVINLNEGDDFKIPVKIFPKSYFTALGFACLTSSVSFWIIYKKIKEMNLLSVLKIRE